MKDSDHISDTNVCQIQSIKGSDAAEKGVRPRSSDSDQRKTKPKAPTFYWS